MQVAGNGDCLMGVKEFQKAERGSAAIDKCIAFRMDDVGASSKRYEIYSDKEWRAGCVRVSANWLFLKYLPSLRKWGPYRELKPSEWEAILQLLQDFDAKLTVAITACWADSETRLTSFPEKFPAQAELIKQGCKLGLIEVANHGLTHVVLENNVFRPKWFEGNRRFHREFVDQVPATIQENNIKKAQDILQSFFEEKVVTLVPPGNAFSEQTIDFAAKHGIKYISCDTASSSRNGLTVLGNRSTKAFHDREVVLEGVGWLEDSLTELSGMEYVFVRDLAERMEAI